MSKDKDEVVAAVRARLDDLEADWAGRLQEIEPKSTDRSVIEAIGIGRAQIIVAVRQLRTICKPMNRLHNPEPAALSALKAGPKRAVSVERVSDK